MKCPRCGNTMEVSQHRNYPINICYACGYMDDHNGIPEVPDETNFQHLMQLRNFNEAAAFIGIGLKISPRTVNQWLEKNYGDDES